MRQSRQSSGQFAILTVAAFSFFLFWSGVASAQFSAGSGNIEFIVSPEFPRSNENVTVTLGVFGIELARSLVTWSVDGEVVKEGLGEKSIIVNSGPLGRSKTVVVKITSLDGQVFSQGVAIRPAEVNLVFESTTYTPPFYRGRAAYTYQSGIRAVALPEIYDENGRKLDPEELIFYWKDNDKPLTGQSGIGKNSAIIKPAVPLNNAMISVEVSALFDPNLAAEARFGLPPRSPTITLYENSPRYGILYNKALTGVLSIKGEELTVRAEPYFFDTGSASSESVSYLWLMNGASVGEGWGLNSLIFRKTSDLSGLAKISVNGRHSTEIFQSGGGGFSLLFEETPKTNR